MPLFVIIALRLSILLTFMFSKTLLFPPLFMSENSRLSFLFKGPTTPPSANVLCEHALYHCQCHIQSDYLWLVFPCLLPIHHVCTRHASTWCTRFFFLSKGIGSHSRGAWCHSDFLVLRFSISSFLYFHCWFLEANMAHFFILHVYLISLHSSYLDSLLIC